VGGETRAEIAEITAGCAWENRTGARASHFALAGGGGLPYNRFTPSESVRSRLPSWLRTDPLLRLNPAATARQVRAGGNSLTISERDTVAALGQAIAQRIGEPRYKLWFKGHTKFTWDDDQLVIGVPNLHFQGWLETKFGAAVAEAAECLFGRRMDVHFRIDPQLFQAARQEQVEAGAIRNPSAVPENPQPEHEADAAFSEETVSPRTTKTTRRWRRLGEFVVGPCNRVAHASAVSVVEAADVEVNPLVVHGPVGTGKTHLLEGVYVGLRKRHPEWDVCYVAAEDFTNRFVQALRLGRLSGFRKRFRECDALLVDDLNFLAGKRASREEFLHTFDTLHATGKQVVVSCDCHPRLAEEFTPELTDRLLGGAVWGLTPPDAETRLAILRAKAAPIRPSLHDDVLRFLAEQLKGNVRELEGALHSVQHYSRVAGREVDRGLAREALGDLLRHSVRAIHLEDIDRAVCQVLRLEPRALQAKQRAWAVSHPRMLAIFLARKHTAASYGDIGRYFGGRNHSTAVAAEKKVRQWLSTDGEITLGNQHFRARELIELIERELRR
jgi:chromosomal replication initiator protein